MDSFLSQENNGIEWMMQSAQVGDEALAEALVYHFYQGLHLMSLQQTGNQASSERLAVQALASGVQNRHRFWNETSLRAWLYKLLIGKVRLEVQDNDDAILYLLVYGHHFTLEETAYVLGIKPESVVSRIDAERRSLYLDAFPHDPVAYGHSSFIASINQHTREELSPAAQAELTQHLQECESCRLYAERLPRLEKQWSSELGNGSVHSANRQAEALQAVIAQASAKTTRRNPLSLPFREMALVLITAALLVFLGRSQGVFEAFDARPTLTPLPSSTPIPGPTPWPTIYPPVELAGIEGVDYFYFMYEPQGEAPETLASLAHKAGLEENTIRYLNPHLRWPLQAHSYEIKLAAKRTSAWFHPSDQGSPDTALTTLNASSSLEEINALLRSAPLFEPVAIERIYLYYGPPGYAGPHHFGVMMQTILFSPRNIILIIRQQEDVFAVIQAGNWMFIKNSSDDRIRGQWAEENLYFWESIFGTLPEDGSIQVKEVSSLLDREVLIVEWTHESKTGMARYWIDTTTGIVYQIGIYSSSSGEIVTQAVSISDLEYSPDISAENLFPPAADLDALLAYFSEESHDDLAGKAIDQLGKRPWPVERQPPPQGFDRFNAPLTLLWPDEPASEQENSVDGASAVQVFAGEYYLGDIEIEPDLTLRNCRRSPNGRMVAMNMAPIDRFNQFSSNSDNRNALVWLDLESLDMSSSGIDVNYVSDMAFSPDSSRMFFFGCMDMCALYEHDLISGETRRASYDSGEALEFSPDGSQIAFMGWGPDGGRTLIVLDAHTFEIIYSGDTTSASPTDNWGRPYPRPDVIWTLFGPLPQGCRLPSQ